MPDLDFLGYIILRFVIILSCLLSIFTIIYKLKKTGVLTKFASLLKFKYRWNPKFFDRFSFVTARKTNQNDGEGDTFDGQKNQYQTSSSTTGSTSQNSSSSTMMGSDKIRTNQTVVPNLQIRDPKAPPVFSPKKLCNGQCQVPDCSPFKNRNLYRNYEKLNNLNTPIRRNKFSGAENYVPQNLIKRNGTYSKNVSFTNADDTSDTTEFSSQQVCVQTVNHQPHYSLEPIITDESYLPEEDEGQIDVNVENLNKKENAIQKKNVLKKKQKEDRYYFDKHYQETLENDYKIKEIEAKLLQEGLKNKYMYENQHRRKNYNHNHRKYKLKSLNESTQKLLQNSTTDNNSSSGTNSNNFSKATSQTDETINGFYDSYLPREQRSGLQGLMNYNLSDYERECKTIEQCALTQNTTTDFTEEEGPVGPVRMTIDL